ncbi:MAG: hypothetical protein GX621_09460 [Pirellulaceae bacterium]|nr:hypothetical protein [Pirellulaceae bacterium]
MPAVSRWILRIVACVLIGAAVAAAWTGWTGDECVASATVAAERTDREAAATDSEADVQRPGDVLADSWPLPEACVTEDSSSLSPGSEGRDPTLPSTGRVCFGHGRPPSGRHLVENASRAHPRRSLQILLCKWVV